MKNRKINFKLLIVCLILVYATAFIGSIFTSSEVNSNWYNSVKPSITPPGYIFPIVWNILFFLIAISLYLSWNSAKNKSQKIKIASVFAINLFLNAFWSYLFFTLKNPVASFIELNFIWISILAMIYTTYKINKNSAYFLIPYFAWVSFAGILNYLIMIKL